LDTGPTTLYTGFPLLRHCGVHHVSRARRFPQEPRIALLRKSDFRHGLLRNPGDLVRCDRQLFEKLKALDANQLAEKTKHYLTKDEVKAVMARRDKIVDRFQKLIAEKGENEVLY